MIDVGVIARDNQNRESGLRSDYDALGAHLDRRGIVIGEIKAKVAAYGVAIPSWGVGTDAVRAVPGAGGAAGRVRQARRLRRDPPADRGHALGLVAHPVGRC